MTERYGVTNERPIINQPRANNKRKKTPQNLIEELLQSLNLLRIECIVEDTLRDTEEAGRKPKRHFRISNEFGKQLLSATSENVFCTRIGYGRIPHPRFNVKLLCPTDNSFDAFHVFRRLRCDSCCCPCSLQMVEIYNSRKRDIVGSVRQKCNPLNAVFQFCDPTNTEIAVVRGQNFKLDGYKVYTLSQIEIGSIRYKAHVKMNNGLECHETWDVFFTDAMSLDMRIMMLGAAFLIENLYIESPKFLRNH